MLTSRKVASKVILVFAFATADVALERVFKSMASHVDCIEYVICKVHVTVLAVVQELGVLDWQGRGWCTRLAVANAGGAGSATTLTTGAGHRATVPMIVCWTDLRAGWG